MSEAQAVLIPLLNANEPEALVADLHVEEGQRVRSGDTLCTLETTKSAADLAAEADGYVAGLRFAQGQTARAGEVLCYLAASPDWKPPEPESAPVTAAGAEELPAGLRITQPALALANEGGLDLSQLPLGPLVTEAAVRGLLAGSEGAAGAAEGAADPTALVVYGGGGHGKALIDLLRALGAYQGKDSGETPEGVFRLVGVVDDGLPQGETVMGLPVLGGGESLPELHARGVRLAVNAVGGIGDISSRIRVFERLAEAGFTCPAVAHPSAVIEASASLSPGSQVFPQAYVGSEAEVGYGAIVNTGAVVSHDCLIEDYANVAPGALLAGGVRVGAGALIGMGVTVNLNVSIGARARVGNGATVKAEVPEGGVVRAGAVWPE